jgi:hypothetical protein
LTAIAAGATVASGTPGGRAAVAAAAAVSTVIAGALGQISAAATAATVATIAEGSVVAGCQSSPALALDARVTAVTAVTARLVVVEDGQATLAITAVTAEPATTRIAAVDALRSRVATGTAGTRRRGRARGSAVAAGPLMAPIGAAKTAAEDPAMFGVRGA